MYTDMEGVTGVVSFEQQSYADGKYHDQAMFPATAEVNAAIDGLLEAGVEEALVFDGHGPGAIDFESLHPAAKLLHGRPAAPPSVRDPIVGTYDACVMMGSMPWPESHSTADLRQTLHIRKAILFHKQCGRCQHPTRSQTRQ